MSWKSFRGDEWWNDGLIGRFSATCDRQNFYLPELPNSLSKLKLYSFLFESFERFNGFNIKLPYNQVTKLQLNALASENLVSFEIENSISGKNILIKSVISNKVNLETSKPKNKSWW